MNLCQGSAKSAFFPLKKGDTIGVVAPSACFEGVLFEHGVACLENHGFKVHIPSSIFAKHRYLAGVDKVRAEVLNQLFQDPMIHGIIAVRGGFGSMRILEHLNWNLIKQNPKLFIGFSDVTAILNALIDQASMAVVHGPNLISLANAGTKTRDSFFSTISGISKISYKGNCLIPGRATAILKGGNLATLTHLIGTRFQPDFGGSILFLEDVGESAYKIDRMLTQMKLAGCFNQLQGVAIGSFANCKNSGYVSEILLEIFEPFKIPILIDLPSGHGKENYSFLLGQETELDAMAGFLKFN